MRILWRRLTSIPTTRIERREGQTTVLAVDGLVCDTICAVRTREALAALPGVTGVTVDFEHGRAHVTGPAHDPQTYERAVRSVVVGRGLRRAIQAAHRRLTRDATQTLAGSGRSP